MIAILVSVIAVAALVYIVATFASGVGIIAGVVSLVVAPPWRSRNAGTDMEEAPVRVSRSRAEIANQAPTPGTAGWDEYVARDNKKYARRIARADRRALRRMERNA